MGHFFAAINLTYKRNWFAGCMAISLAFATVCFGQGPNADRLPANATMQFGDYGIAHGERLSQITFVDNETLIVTDVRSKAKLWNVQTGNLRSSLPDIGRPIALSADGSKIAFSTHNGLFIGTLSGLETRQQGVKKLSSWRRTASAIAFASDDNRLATCDQQGTVSIWNLQSGLHRELAKETFGTSLAFSPDGTMLVSGGGDYRHETPVKLWSVDSGELLMQFEQTAKSATVQSLEFSPDGDSVLVCTTTAVWIWNVATGTRHQLSESSARAAFSPNGKTVLVSNQPRILDTQSGKEIIRLDTEEKFSGPCAFSPDGKHVAIGHDNKVELFETATGNRLAHRSGHSAGARSVVVSKGGVFTSLSRLDRSVRVWGPTTGRQLRKLDVDWDGQDVWWNEEGSDLFSIQDGRTLATWTSGGRVLMWNVGDFKKRELRFQKGSLFGESSSRPEVAATQFTLSANGSICAFAGYEVSSDGIHLFEMDGQEQIGTLMPFEKRSHDAWIGSMALNNEGTRLAVGCLLGSHNSNLSVSVQIWDVEKREKLRSFRPATSPPGRLCFSPDGKLLATAASGTSPVQAWRVADGSEVAKFQMQGDYHGRDPTPLAFSHDGKLIAAADLKNKLYVYELATKKQIKTFQGHIKPMTSVVFSYDRKYLVTASEDGTLLKWKLNDLDPTSEPKNLTAQQLAEYWDALANRDPRIAKNAIDILTVSPKQATQMCSERLTPALTKPSAELAKLISDLQNESPKVHLAALARLQDYGEKATAPLFQALTNADGKTAKRNIETAMERISEFPIASADLQRGRAIELLEIIGTKDARSIVNKFFDQSTDKHLKEEAQLAARRMHRKSRP